METLKAYLDRKQQELALLNSCLNKPLSINRPASVAEAIKGKFQLAAALKAEQALHDWALTETAWAHPGRWRSGPFEFSYDYQRADLEVRGPSFYQFDAPKRIDTVYTSSGMAALSALLQASAQIIPQADLLVLPGSYGETLELVESYVKHLRPVCLKSPSAALASSADRPRLLLLDSYTPALPFEAALHCAKAQVDLLIFDTTCFSGGSGQIRRVLNWAARWQLPVVLVRSHTKLDSLGVEYGRLGSASFVACDVGEKQHKLEQLAIETRKAVRLFGGAAMPAHFPPYVGTKTYQDLTNKRIAAILRNSRRTARYFASALPGSLAQLHYTHALYVTLAPQRMANEEQARRIAEDLARDLSGAKLPLRHAGSFGFDFAAVEWFRDSDSGRYLVRIAVPDLPTLLWDEVAEAVAQWWSVHQAASRSRLQ